MGIVVKMGPPHVMLSPWLAVPLCTSYHHGHHKAKGDIEGKLPLCLSHGGTLFSHGPSQTFSNLLASLGDKHPFNPNNLMWLNCLLPASTSQHHAANHPLLQTSFGVLHLCRILMFSH